MQYPDTWNEWVDDPNEAIPVHLGSLAAATQSSQPGAADLCAKAAQSFQVCGDRMVAEVAQFAAAFHYAEEGGDLGPGLFAS
jgi:hypothetical protein